jgi:O-antigen ligase
MATVSGRGPAPFMRAASRGLVRIVPPALWVVAALLVLPLLVGAATYRGLLEPLAIGVAGVAAIIFTLVKPRATLLIYVALIPWDDFIAVGEAGTITRAVGAVFFAGYFLHRFGQIRLRTIPRTGWAFLAWALASFVWALDQSVAGAQLLTLLQLFVMMVVVADFAAEEPDVVRQVLIAFSLSAVGTAVFAIGAAAVGGGIGEDRIGAFESQDVAQFAALLVPAFLFLLVELVEWRRPLIAGAGFLLVSAGIVLSGTRSAWVAAGVGAAVIVLPLIGRRGLVPIVMIALAGLSLFTIDELRGVIVDRLSTALESGGTGRVDIWAVGLNIFGDQPIVGVGYGNFPVAFTPEVIRDTNVPGLDVNVLDPGAGSHSIIVGTIVELGIVGLILLVPFLWSVIFGRGRGMTWNVVHGTVIALLAQAVFLDVLNRKHVWLFLGLALGMMWRLVADAREAERLEAEEAAAREAQARVAWVGRT